MNIEERYEQVAEEHRKVSQKLSQLQQAYLNNKTQANWKTYEKYHAEVYHPVMVEMSQITMRRQMQYMTAEEWSAIVD